MLSFRKNELKDLKSSSYVFLQNTCSMLFRYFKPLFPISPYIHALIKKYICIVGNREMPSEIAKYQKKYLAKKCEAIYA